MACGSEPNGKWSYEFKFQGRGTELRLSDQGRGQGRRRKRKRRLKKSTTHITFLEAATKRLGLYQAYGTLQYYGTILPCSGGLTAGRYVLEDISLKSENRLIELADSLGRITPTGISPRQGHLQLAAKDGLLIRNPCLGISKFPNQKAVKYIPPGSTSPKASPGENRWTGLSDKPSGSPEPGQRSTTSPGRFFFDKGSYAFWTRKKKEGPHPRLIKMIPEVERAYIIPGNVG